MLALLWGKTKVKAHLYFFCRLFHFLISVSPFCSNLLLPSNFTDEILFSAVFLPHSGLSTKQLDWRLQACTSGLPTMLQFQVSFQLKKASTAFVNEIATILMKNMVQPPKLRDRHSWFFFLKPAETQKEWIKYTEQPRTPQNDYTVLYILRCSKCMCW